MQPAAPYRVQKKPSMDPIFSHMNSVCVLKPHYFMAPFNITMKIGVQLPVGTRDFSVLRRALTGSQAHHLLHQIDSRIKEAGA
jgi:hypothetical protein